MLENISKHLVANRDLKGRDEVNLAPLGNFYGTAFKRQVSPVLLPIDRAGLIERLVGHAAEFPDIGDDRQ